MSSHPPVSPFAGLAFGVLAISCAAILIRLAEAPSFVIAAYRLALAAGVLLLITLIRRGAGFRGLPGRVWRWSALAGLLLAIHFAVWISSLSYTSVASSVVLVTTSPVFVGLASYGWLGERLSGRMLAGILVSVSGGVMIGYEDFVPGGRALFGDMLAIVGAMTVGGYLMIGRKLRGQVGLLPYITIVYSAAAVLLVGLALGSGQALTGYGTSTYLLLFGLAAGPQLLGHSSLNWALKYLSAAFVSVSTLAEPVGSALLAYLILDEGVSPVKMTGGGLVLAGIYVVMRAELKPRIPLPER
jgi:drug/metabolite transporter (DMT)-like permease